MSTTREELSKLVADVVVEHFERLRADVLTKVLQMRTPTFKITPMGELYCDGELVGDVRPVFQKAVNQALKVAQVEEPGE